MSEERDWEYWVTFNGHKDEGGKCLDLNELADLLVDATEDERAKMTVICSDGQELKSGTLLDIAYHERDIDWTVNIHDTLWIEQGEDKSGRESYLVTGSWVNWRGETYDDFKEALLSYFSEEDLALHFGKAKEEAA